MADPTPLSIIDNLEKRLDRHEDAQDRTTLRIFTRLDEISEDLAHRLPAWATGVIALLSLLLGITGGSLFLK